MPVRWCHRLTDVELGYKLFVKVDGLSASSTEWGQLKNGNDIPLLIAVRNNKIDVGKVIIQKIDNPNAAAPTKEMVVSSFAVDFPATAVVEKVVSIYPNPVENISKLQLR